MAWATVTMTDLVVAVYLTVSVGVKVAVNVCAPTLGTEPEAGLYKKEPATLLVALS